MKPKTKLIIISFFLVMPLFMPFGTRAFSFVVCGDRGGINDEKQAVENLTSGPKSGGNYDSKIQAFDRSTCKLPQLFKLIAVITNFLIGLAGFFSVVRITIAGFQMVAASSTGNEGGITEAKGAITNALIGLVLVMIAYVVINTIFSIFAVQIGAATKYSFPFNPLNMQ